MTGLPAWRPGTPVRYWTGDRKGNGEIGLTGGGPIVRDGQPVVLIAERDVWLPLTHVEALSPAEASGVESAAEAALRISRTPGKAKQRK